MSFPPSKLLPPALVLSAFSSLLFAQTNPPVTAVRIVGLQGMSEEEVLERLGGRLDFITSRPPSRSRADDADFLVSSLLEKEGYSDVTISWRIPADRRSIVLTVNSGPRLTIGEVKVVGAPAGEEETMAKYFTGSSLLGGETEVPYLPGQVDEASRNTVTYLKAQGYWEATGQLSRVDLDAQRGKTDLTMAVTPGPLHTIASLELAGELPPQLPKLPQRLQRYVGKTATAETLREIRDGTTAEMRAKGYQLASSSLVADHRGGRSFLTLTLDPGYNYRLRGTALTGGDGMDLSRVRRLFARQSGQRYDEKEITKLRNSLLATGAFDSVDQLREIDEEEQAIDVTLHLREGKPKGISYYAGAGSFEGFILGASYYDRNFLSKLYNLNIAAEISGVGFLGEVSVTDPWVLGYDLRATPRAFALTRTYDEYRKFETGFGLTLSTDLTDRQTLELDAGLSFATIGSEGLPSEELGVTDYFLTTVGATWLYDGRNSGVSPSKGFFGRVRGEFGAVGAEVPNAFLRLEGQASYHLPLNEESRLAFNLKTGLLAPTDGDELPVDLRYFIGGADSVRSFANRQLGPQAGGEARGGQAFWYANAEYVRKLAGPVYGVVFLDAGSLDELATSWPSFEPKLAAGAGLRLDLPIGPIRLEYGHALNPSDNDPEGTFHFSIGASF
ncbi:BamA/OMP85 family outer membrane protein [Roseibacillus ishigakijimensis]|uniref:BamA/TamA family outer membrane protein n=1 Tax=Roseibacillus ishigakijimensis TaxID=454146 RepID=A0A934RPB9_9BACT|nr:BamA/TamA family outer membrane protein [Roseibacillus ishigakijimensis]MBK1835522.1 BamA/TamA family outer membrane protein [Roseibacillus ishigakijimensis]